MHVIDGCVEHEEFLAEFDDLAARLGSPRWVVFWSDGRGWLRLGRADPRDEMLAALAQTSPGTLDGVDPAELGVEGARLRAAGLTRLSAVVLDEAVEAVAFFEEPTEALTSIEPMPSWFGVALRQASRLAPLTALESWLADLTGAANGRIGAEQLLGGLVTAFGLDSAICATPAPRGALIMSCSDAGGPEPVFDEIVDFETEWAELAEAPDSLFDRLHGPRAGAPWRSVVQGDGLAVLLAVEGPAVSDRLDLVMMATLLGQALRHAHETGRARSRAQLEERSRLATVLHEELSQRLAAVSVQIDLIRNRANGAAVSDQLSALRLDVVGAMEALRSAIYELTPPEPGWARLEDGLARFVDDHAHSRGLEVEYEVEGEACPVDPEQVSLMFAVVQEALTNVAKHAGTDEATVRVEFETRTVTVIVRDDGEGLIRDPLEGPTWGHQGLGVLRTRARLAGAAFEVTGGPGEGTTVRVSVPSSVAGVAETA